MAYESDVRQPAVSNYGAARPQYQLMQFNRITVDQLKKLTIPMPKAYRVYGYPTIWMSSCECVVIIMQNWQSMSECSVKHSIVVYANRLYLVGFPCALDGSAAFVANEVLDILSKHTFTSEDGLKQLLVDLLYNMKGDGSGHITLPMFHKYKERQ